MVLFEIEYRVRLPREEMWSLREDPEFLRWQYEHSSDMSNLEIVEKNVDAADPDRITVTWRITPSVPLPQFVLAYVGEGAGIYIEDVHEYRLSKPYYINFRSHPNMFQEYTETRGECEFVDEPADSADAQAGTRVCIRGEVIVNVPLVGPYVENFVVNNLRNFYTGFPDLVHSYVAAKNGRLNPDDSQMWLNPESSVHVQPNTAEANEASAIHGAGADVAPALAALQRSLPPSVDASLASVPVASGAPEAIPESIQAPRRSWWPWQ
ncbi:hypothetical protein CYME_CMS026C [Cyanidioschyzon merolae strain 10D]|uniref:Uncharacterized protein n=1 Tax=Cyanidioschyzon merolae (strain NIES-3377 / 10D) TaxID=280699 RepID=M1UWN1_CYAM1|nr:hypothetical protein CYME_CMS026C [Cyanidioschyzon merolae strain 10D]BAM82676.1 hypothetical protein CYME_CMS026C [Cyanidioschyzon merolae strain 10D]|eukprot:XP_005538712.1 hypothetical protein CYME_CMS026C [Cyanidioschyzon merolae strain 10D]